MKNLVSIILVVAFVNCFAAENEEKIDRKALVSRHSDLISAKITSHLIETGQLKVEWQFR